MATYSYWRHAPLRAQPPEPDGHALDAWGAIFSALGAGILGLAHTWPAVNKWTHGTLITPMHGHMAFFGAYVMIMLGMISYALPGLTGRERELARDPAGFWAFWLQVAGMFGMTMAFAAAGLTQTYLERILGIGYLETQLKIQVHFLMLSRPARSSSSGWRSSCGTSSSWPAAPVPASASQRLAPAHPTA